MADQAETCHTPPVERTWRTVGGLVGTGIFVGLVGCGGDEETYAGGFESPQACAEGLVFLEDGDIAAKALVEQCKVSPSVAREAVAAHGGEGSADEVPEADAPDEAAVPVTTSLPPTTAAAATLMPGVRCMNLQDAQDEIQRQGTFFSRSPDATGQGRNQIIDSNWIVVDQDPAPGVPIGEGEALLYVVKYDEPNDC
jgi:hypothetical protein